MGTYRLYAIYTGSKYLGEVEADSAEAAEEMGWEHKELHVGLCHHCAHKIDINPDANEIQVEEDAAPPRGDADAGATDKE